MQSYRNAWYEDVEIAQHTRIVETGYYLKVDFKNISSVSGCPALKPRDAHSSKRSRMTLPSGCRYTSKYDPAAAKPVSKLDAPNIHHVYLSPSCGPILLYGK